MSGALLVAGLWAVAATGAAARPGRGEGRRLVWGLVTAGIPILGWVTYRNGPWAGLVVLALGAAVLRWPPVGLWRRLRGRAAG